MKIVIGKFSHEPFHALSKKEVSLLLKLVPKDWSANIHSVVLSAKIFKKNKLAKPIEYKTTSKQLTLFSRGLDRENIARAVLLELASIAATNVLAERAQLEAAELDNLIAPYMSKFLKARFN